MMTHVAKSAYLSEDGKYRYHLARVWDSSLPSMAWIMLNPSTADAAIDDPTILACMDFARRNGCGSIDVVNLFAFRSPHPKVMQAADDPVGPHNDEQIQTVFRAVRADGFAIAAWGTGGSYLGRDEVVARLAEENGLSLKCFGKTKDGHPKHPLARGKHRIDRGTKPLLLRDTNGY